MKVPTWAYWIILIVLVLLTLSSLPKRQEAWNKLFSKEGFVSKKCPDGTRSDGPCLMEFPGF